MFPRLLSSFHMLHSMQQKMGYGAMFVATRLSSVTSWIKPFADIGSSSKNLLMYSITSFFLKPRTPIREYRTLIFGSLMICSAFQGRVVTKTGVCFSSSPLMMPIRESVGSGIAMFPSYSSRPSSKNITFLGFSFMHSSTFWTLICKPCDAYIWRMWHSVMPFRASRKGTKIRRYDFIKMPPNCPVMCYLCK